jgi:glycerophosphoryl diester phosphodiesterase
MDAVKRRLHILNDFAFLKSFGEKGNEPQLIAFLNAVLRRTGRKRIVSLEIIENKELPPEMIEEVLRMDTMIRLAEDKMAMIMRDPALLHAYDMFELSRIDYKLGMQGARQERAMEIAKNLKAMGIAIEQITSATGLTVDEIGKL